MGKMKKFMAAAVLLSLAVGCTGCGEDSAKKEKEYNVTLITMDQMDVHWVNVNAGVEDAISELEKDGYTINYNWYAPDTKDNDPNACNQALKEASADGAKIIYIDSPATFEGEATFATDNYAAGEQAGEEMLKVLDEAGITEGTIGLVSAQAGVQSCVDRVDGFCKALEGTGFTPSEVQYSEGDTAKAQELATNLINNGAVAMYGANEAATIGCGNAARDAKTKVYCVGFDNSSANRALVQKDAVQAFMAQNPHEMGEQAMKAAVRMLDGENLGGEVTDTGVSVVTAENVDEFES